MPRADKINEGGYLIAHARDAIDMSQSQLAEKLAPVLKKEPSRVLSQLKNYEAGRVQIPVSFLEILGITCGLPTKWYEQVQKQEQRHEKWDKYRQASTIPDVFVLRAPSSRPNPLRSLFVLDKSQWRSRERLPGIFADGLGEQTEGRFPSLIADVVEDADEKSDFVRTGDVFAVRTDLEPMAGRMVLATGKRGEKYRRLMMLVDGRLVLRLPHDPRKDVPLIDVASIEGLIIGRVRGTPDDEEDPYNVVHLKKGMRAEDL